jgi:hypothetical protein
MKRDVEWHEPVAPGFEMRSGMMRGPVPIVLNAALQCRGIAGRWQYRLLIRRERGSFAHQQATRKTLLRRFGNDVPATSRMQIFNVSV